ncbi:MAG: acetyl-CoA carboxylase biotin carboxyl carrier protein [Deltaproteobacteria bacterium]|nr:acetyl-CoA carboxylase biotin carboxyl carrier protein [Deltaproteobacteria bacterium]
MDIKDVKALYKFLKNTDIVEFELEDTRGKLRLKRGAAFDAIPMQAQMPAVVQPAGSQVEPEGVKAPQQESENVKTITSPMVGTFYRSSSPEAPSFVETGSQVGPGQIVCIIEAMKLMNEIESEFKGKVLSILVENGQPVEYGEPLFKVEV